MWDTLIFISGCTMILLDIRLCAEMLQELVRDQSRIVVLPVNKYSGEVLLLDLHQNFAKSMK